MRHVKKPLRVLIALCSAVLLSGCAAGRPASVVPPAPGLVRTALCPAPAAPRLPLINGELPFDHPVNVAAAMERDDLLRQYIAGLADALECYAAQAGERSDDDN